MLINRSMWSRLWPLLTPVRKRLAVVVGAEVLLVAVVFLRPWFVRQVIDHGLVRGPTGLVWSPRVVLTMGAGLTLCWVARFVLAAVSQYLAGTAALRVVSELRARIFAHVQGLSVRYFDRAKAGRIVSRVDRDVDSLEPLLIQGPPELLSALLRCLVSGTLLFRLSPRLFLALVWIIPVLAPAVFLFQRIACRNYGRIAERRGRFTAHLVESVAAVRIIKQTVQEEPNRQRYRQLVYDFNHTLVRGNARTGWFLPLTGLLSAVGMAMMLLVGGREMALSHLTLGQVAESLFYVFLFLGPLQELGDLSIATRPGPRRRSGCSCSSTPNQRFSIRPMRPSSSMCGGRRVRERDLQLRSGQARAGHSRLLLACPSRPSHRRRRPDRPWQEHPGSAPDPILPAAARGRAHRWPRYLLGHATKSAPARRCGVARQRTVFRLDPGQPEIGAAWRKQGRPHSRRLRSRRR